MSGMDPATRLMEEIEISRRRSAWRAGAAVALAAGVVAAVAWGLITEIDREKAALEGDVAGLDAENASLNERVGDLAAALSEAETRIEAQSHHIAVLEAQLAATNQPQVVSRDLFFEILQRAEAVLGALEPVAVDGCWRAGGAGWRKNMEEQEIGSPAVAVRMLKPALASFERIVNKVRVFDPDLASFFVARIAACLPIERALDGPAQVQVAGLAINLGSVAVTSAAYASVLEDLFMEEGWIGNGWPGAPDQVLFVVQPATFEQWLREDLIDVPF